MRLPLRSTPRKLRSGYILASPTVYSPLPQASSRVSGWSFRKNAPHCPAMPSGYCRTLGKDLIASNRMSFFWPMKGTKVRKNPGTGRRRQRAGDLFVYAEYGAPEILFIDEAKKPGVLGAMAVIAQNK